MHARIQELLSIRDGEPVDGAVRLHVESCAACGAELEQLAELQRGLRRLPTLYPPAHTWNGVRERLAAPPQRSSRYGPALGTGGAMLACLLAFLWMAHRGMAPGISTGSGVRDPVPGVPARPTGGHGGQAASGDAELGPLVAHSQRLEALLRALPPRPAAEKAVTSATIDELQNRIQWLDLELAAGNDGDAAHVRHLWDARVRLLNSLLYMRYAESAGRPAASMQLGVI